MGQTFTCEKQRSIIPAYNCGIPFGALIGRSPDRIWNKADAIFENILLWGKVYHKVKRVYKGLRGKLRRRFNDSSIFLSRAFLKLYCRIYGDTEICEINYTWAEICAAKPYSAEQPRFSTCWSRMSSAMIRTTAQLLVLLIRFHVQLIFIPTTNILSKVLSLSKK